jgi:hypothetical protein
MKNLIFLTVLVVFTNIAFSQSTFTYHHYDVLGREDSTVTPDGSYIKTTYDYTGNILSVAEHSACDNVAIPVITGNNGICSGDSTKLTATTAAKYIWSTGDTTQSIWVKSGGSYIVTVTYTNDCEKTSQPFSITLHTAQRDSISSSKGNTICAGDTTQLSAGSYIQYRWSTGDTIQALQVNPLVSTTYSITATDINGCSTKDSIMIAVKQSTAATISIVLCKGGVYTIGSQTFNQDGVYTVRLTNAVGCDSIVTLYLRINDPNITLHDTTICAGQMVMISVADTGVKRSLNLEVLI